MNKFLILCFIIFTSCAQNSANRYFTKDSSYTQNLEFTKKVFFSKSNKIISIVYISYLNGFAKEFKNKDKEYFLVGIYGTSSKYKDYSNNIKISLENFKIKTAENIEVFPKEKYKVLFSNIYLKNNWARYKIYSFSKSKVPKYNFKIKIEDLKLHKSAFIDFDKQ